MAEGTAAWQQGMVRQGLPGKIHGWLEEEGWAQLHAMALKAEWARMARLTNQTNQTNRNCRKMISPCSGTAGAY